MEGDYLQNITKKQTEVFIKQEGSLENSQANWLINSWITKPH